MTPQEKDDAKVRHDLQAIAHFVDKQIPFGWGFVILAFPLGTAEGRMNYVSNADRPDVVRAMYEFIEASKAKWGEYAPEGAAAEDSELGRLRQRVAESDRLIDELTQALAARGVYPPHTKAEQKLLEEAAKLVHGEK
jgi:hypothetical protein